MNSIFDPEFQNNDISSKIVFALERISQVFRVNLWRENKKHRLSPIQMQILIFLRYQGQHLRTVTRLATEFNMTKATISDAVSSLEQKGLIIKERNPDDARSSLLQVTAEGKKTAGDIALFTEDLRLLVEQITSVEKEVVFRNLLMVISNLEEAGTISQQRMCQSCQYFRKVPSEDRAYYCALLERPLSGSELRIDCPEHLKITV